MTSNARAALFEAAGEDWREAKAASAKAGELEIIAINRLRDCGMKLREAADHVRPSLEWFQRNRDHLPEDMTWGGFRFCVNVSHQLSEAITDLQEARQARRSLFQAFGDEQAPKRLHEQNGHESNPWSDFVSETARLLTFADRLEEEPMTKWSREKLNAFARTTKPVVDRYNQALKLLS